MIDADNEILHFSFASVMADGDVLAMHPTKGIIAHMISLNDAPRLIHVEIFTAMEMRIILPIFEQTPSHCPYEVLYASLNRGNTTEKTVERCRIHLQEAQAAGVWDQEIRPIRGVMSRVRLKLRSFGIDVRSIVDTGYLLIVKEQSR